MLCFHAFRGAETNPRLLKACCELGKRAKFSKTPKARRLHQISHCGLEREHLVMIKRTRFRWQKVQSTKGVSQETHIPPERPPIIPSEALFAMWHRCVLSFGYGISRKQEICFQRDMPCFLWCRTDPESTLHIWKSENGKVNPPSDNKLQVAPAGAATALTRCQNLDKEQAFFAKVLEETFWVKVQVTMVSCTAISDVEHFWAVSKTRDFVATASMSEDKSWPRSNSCERDNAIQV